MVGTTLKTDGTKNVLLEHAEEFAVRVVLLCDAIETRKPLYVVTRQLTRSATSIGANATEAQSAVSKADFYNKLSIALKEARETAYWLRILLRTGRISDAEYESFGVQCNELISLLVAITRRVKEGL